MQLTIGIITCGRPHAVQNCIDSINRHISTPYRLVVVDSLIDDTAYAYYSSIDNLKLIAFEKPIGPAEGRKIIIEHTQTPYLLLLDDDLALRPGTLNKMLNHLEKHSEVSIVCGSWLEKGGYRILGQRIIQNRGMVQKHFVSRKQALKAGVEHKQVDIGQASMLIKSDIFKCVNFDAQFDFYFDLFDFFMQCKSEGILTHALTDATFDHFPGKYKRAKTLRQIGNKDDDKVRFEEKWEVTVDGSTGAKLEFDSQLQKMKYKINLLLNT